MRDQKSPATKNQSISRRRFLSTSSSGLALAGAVILPAWAQQRDLLQLAQGKQSKASARYQDKPNGSQQCSGCTHFRGGSCEIVEGQISPNGWCRHFKAKSGSSGRSGGTSSGGGSGGGGGRSGY